MKLNYILGLGIVLSLVGISLLFSFGFLYLKPYLNVVKFQEAICRTSSISLSQTLVQCQCAADGRSVCLSEYPCFLVRVNFTALDNIGDFVPNVILYDSFETYYLFETYIPQNDTKRQCSYHKCNREKSDNKNSVNQFIKRRLDTNTSYQCFYDPDDRSFALVDVVVLSTVANCMFWPALAFVVGMVIFFVEVFHVDKKKTTSQRNQFSSLERQWARIRERSYGRMTSAGSERLVQVDHIDGTSHNVVCLQP